MGELDEAVPNPALLACMGEGGDQVQFDMEWTADELFLLINSLEHVLTPSEFENRWFGGVYPVDMTPECEDAMLGLGYDDLQVPLTMLMVGVESPVL